MLQVRLYALYQRSRTILAFMVSCYVCEIAAVSTIMIFLGADAQSTSGLPANPLPVQPR